MTEIRWDALSNFSVVDTHIFWEQVAFPPRLKKNSIAIADSQSQVTKLITN